MINWEITEKVNKYIVLSGAHAFICYVRPNVVFVFVLLSFTCTYSSYVGKYL